MLNAKKNNIHHSSFIIQHSIVHMQYLSGNEVRQTFLDFYAQRGHQVLPSASLVPEDPTVLLTIAGM
ncbi:MAG TPA: alanine--tRNA ligase-related protein, partial [Leptolyngbyaceae cyanobacterium]